ncbi:MAG: DUF6076 domain-containing protein [Lachnospiraceae bacterium]|nr:DUF6076 domain-containing protein [Lachnospiraceae bacterium]
MDFDKESISPSGLFLVFTAKHQDFMNYHLLAGMAIAPTRDGNIDFEVIDNVNADKVTDKKEQLAIVDKLNEKGANPVSFTMLQDFADFLYFEFAELLKQGLQIRKCRLCEKYFALQNKHKTLFCDRIYSGKRTCKQVGNKQEYDRWIAADPALQEYERIYKARHAQMERDEQKESPADSGRAKQAFGEWSKNVRKLRKQYFAEEISGKYLMEKIYV